VLCRRRLPLPGTARRLRRSLQRAGFEGVRIHWAWPPQRRSPAFWLPIDEPLAVAYLLRLRPVAAWPQAVARRLWRVAAAIGALAPLTAIARKPGAPAAADEIEALLPDGGDSAWLLLTGGKRSINKVVGVPFATGREAPRCVVKFARVVEAEEGLEREVSVLRALDAERPQLAGIPRVIASGRRAGRLAVAQTALAGRPLLASLSARTFPEHAERVADWLVELAGRRPPQAAEEWQGRLVEAPLADFESSFGPFLAAAERQRLRALLGQLPALPPTCEHRDCSPWNLLVDRDGSLAAVDWESAEPHGLPGLDLAYFLINAAFVLEEALDSGRTREAYARLLDPASATGEVFARCTGSYCERLGIDPDTFARLRLLCWVVHCRSDRRHLAMAAGGPPAAAELNSSLHLGLLQDDLARQENSR
jgi:hypothetical protein